MGGKIITLKVLHAFQFSTFLYQKEDYELRKKNLLIIKFK